MIVDKQHSNVWCGDHTGFNGIQFSDPARDVLIVQEKGCSLIRGKHVRTAQPDMEHTRDRSRDGDHMGYKCKIRALACPSALSYKQGICRDEWIACRRRRFGLAHTGRAPQIRILLTALILRRLSHRLFGQHVHAASGAGK